MVYCTKCGTKNEEDAVVCVKCGAPLVAGPPLRRARRRAEEECFGLPHGGAIVGLVIGIIIIIAGISWLAEIEIGNWWALIVIAFGILMIAGFLYRLSRRY